MIIIARIVGIMMVLFAIILNFYKPEASTFSIWLFAISGILLIAFTMFLNKRFSTVTVPYDQEDVVFVLKKAYPTLRYLQKLLKGKDEKNL